MDPLDIIAHVVYDYTARAPGDNRPMVPFEDAEFSRDPRLQDRTFTARRIARAVLDEFQSHGIKLTRVVEAAR